MAYTVMAYTVMAYVVVAYIVVAERTCRGYRSGLYSYGLYSCGREGLQRIPTQPQCAHSACRSSTAPPHHHNTTVPQRPSITAPRHHSEKSTIDVSIVFLACRSARCCIGGAHTTSARSTGSVKFAEVALPPGSLGEISLTSRKWLEMSGDPVCV